ncbi:MAG: DUF1559 domain-containing protein [Thermoguttaceae bacterium]|nr:DUF1559 domain-containing protein [Thermoguttaceae bacterium]
MRIFMNAYFSVSIGRLHRKRVNGILRGFTLVELLVVIAIIGMLVGLLLPAVQQAREAARQMQCSNNLKNLALAALNHESSSKYYPSGGWSWSFTGDPDRGMNRHQPGGWTFSLLPFLEQNAIYQYSSNGQKDTPDKAKAAEVLQMPVGVFNCPSRRTAKVYPGANDSLVNANSSGLKSSGTTMLAKSDYAGNYGGKVANPGEARVYPSSYEKANEYSRNNNWPTQNTDGTIYALSEVTIAQIKDGTTNTYLFGEKYVQSSTYETAGSSCDDNGIWVGADCDSCRVTYKSSATIPVQDRANYDEYSMRFGSPHAGAFGMAMCDGSTQRISYSIDQETHYWLGVRNDGESVTLGN